MPPLTAINSTEAPQTAEQINAAQTGKIEVAAKHASPILPLPKPADPVTPEGWWHIDSAHPGHKDSKDVVVAQIQACAKTPAVWKAALIAEISEMDCKALEVHAHATPDTKGFTLTVRIVKLF